MNAFLIETPVFFLFPPFALFSFDVVDSKLQNFTETLYHYAMSVAKKKSYIYIYRAQKEKTERKLSK